MVNITLIKTTPSPLATCSLSQESGDIIMMKLTVFWDIVPNSLLQVPEVLTASITTMMMEAVSTSERSVNFYQTTQCNIPEDCHVFMLATIRT
jgi:hypothetical protein